MEQKVNFAQYQQVRTSDLANIQDYAEASLDDVVYDTLVSDMRFSGLLATQSGPAAISVATGRLYVGGKVYFIPSTSSFDFTTQLPVAAKKIVLLTAWGSEADTNVEPVNFLNVTQSTPQAPVYTPQNVATTHARVLNLGTAIGVEAPSPSDPVISGTLLAIARVVLAPTGVVSVTMLTANEVPNLEDVDGRVGALEAWEAVAAPEIASLLAIIARLSNDANNTVNQALIGRMLARIAVLDSKNGVPTNAADSWADFFLDPTTSELTDPLSNCAVAEGVRFPDAGAADAAIQLFNPLNPLASIAGNVLFPAYTENLRATVGPQTGSQQISAYTYQTTSFVQLTMTRTRTRWGTPFTVCTNSAFWSSGSYDPTTQIFKLPSGETFSLNPADAQKALINHQMVRLTEYWVDNWQVPYWDVVSSTTTLSGASVQETFPVGQDMWCSSIAAQFTQLDSSGPVTLYLCATTPTGEVDPTQVLGQVTVLFANLTTQGKVKFTFPTPVYLQAGNRYGFRLVTAANHYVATAAGTAFPNGMFFGIVGGVAIPDPTHHLVFDLYACKFSQSLVAIDLVGLQLSGGICGIDILARSIAPSSTSLTFVVQSGGQWIPLSAATAGQLNSGGALPPLLPFRAIFSGTPDMMPCLDLLNSNVHVNRPGTAYTNIWPHGGQAIPAPSTQIRQTIRYENWNAAYHTASCSLLTGTGFSTVTAPSSYSDVNNPDGSLERTYVWNLGSAISSFKFKSVGATSTPLIVFHEAWVKGWSL